MWKIFKPFQAVEAQLARIGDRLDAAETQQGANRDVPEVAWSNSDLDALEQRCIDAVDSINGRLEQLEEGRQELVLAVSEGIERTDRAERRIKATIKRARRELADAGLTDPALEAEAAELQLIDDRASDPGPVPPVQAAVEQDTEVDQPIPGVPGRSFRRMRRA